MAMYVSFRADVDVGLILASLFFVGSRQYVNDTTQRYENTVASGERAQCTMRVGGSAARRGRAGMMQHATD